MNRSFKRFLLISAVALTLGASLVSTADAVTLYSVRPHETIAQIARDHHVSVDSLRKINGDLGKNATLKTGQVIMIPEVDELVQASSSNVAIHSYRIINPTRKVIAEVKADTSKGLAKTAVPTTDAPKADGAKVVDTAKPAQVTAPVPVAESSKPVQVAAAPVPTTPQPDTRVIIEQNDVQPATSPDTPVTHVPNQENIAIIDSQIIHVPVYVAPVDTTPSPVTAGSSASAHHPTELASRHGSLVASVISMAHHFMGIPYVWGGTTPSGFDCSGFTQRVFALSGISIPRLADAQYYQGTPVKDPSPGDLVFFSTYLPGPSHVGIYLGGNQFIHASSRRGVTVSSLSDAYYAKAYIGARRYF